MAEVVLPSLLDRLTGFVRLGYAAESMAGPAATAAARNEAIRRIVTRDLDWLLNTVRLEPTPQSDPDAAALWAMCPEAHRSVVNFGLPPLAGGSAQSLTARRMESIVREMIVNFEPRIDPKSIEVRIVRGPRSAAGQGTLSLEIKGMVWGQPLRQELRLRTEILRETGTVNKLREEE